MLLIGSQALRQRAPNAFDRECVDWDYICTIEEFDEFVETQKRLGVLTAVYPMSGSSMVAKTTSAIHEFSIAWPGTTNEELLNAYCNDSSGVASLNVLLLLKMSHRYRKDSPHFLKTMRDIHLLRKLGATIPDGLKGVLKRREAETYTYAHPNLMQAKGQFFDASVKYTYDHDSIHEAVAVGERPAYTHFQKDGAEVYTSKQKFFALSLDVRLNAGLEESYVLAIERSLVPHPGIKTPKEAFTFALGKVCTSITSGWFREFCWENYDAIMERYSDDYYNVFLKALAEGRIRPAVEQAA